MNYKIISKSLRITALAIIAILFSTCTKETLSDENTLTDGQVVNNMLYFNSINNLIAYIEKANSLELSKLRIIEETKGFISFGRKCDEIYCEIDMESLRSSTELTDYVAKNSKYVCIEKNEEGELEYKTVNSNCPFRYIANEENLFQIKNEVYKLFIDGLASTNIENIELLKKINGKSLANFTNTDKIRIITTNSGKSSTSNYKDATYNCGTEQSASATSGNNRTKMELSATWELNQMIGGYNVYYAANALIRPYKKTLGIWYWCSRTMSCNLKIALDYKIKNVWYRKTGSHSVTDQSTSKIEKTVVSYNQNLLSSEAYGLDYHLGGYDCWADSPSTSKAILKCNEGLVD